MAATKMDWQKTMLIAAMGAVVFTLIIRWSDFQESMAPAERLSAAERRAAPDSAAQELPAANESGASELPSIDRSEEHTSELQSRGHLVCRLLLEKKNKRRQE